MTDILQNISLNQYNTFGVDVKAKYFAVVNTNDDLNRIAGSDIFRKEKHLVTGGGSNLLFSGDYNGLIIKMNTKGIAITGEEADNVFVTAAAGEIWDDLVNYTLEKNFGGIENLSGIPGTVGASPVQNIGAYGTELKDVFYSLDAFNTEDHSIRTFYAGECEFGYRESVFKKALKVKFIILNVTLKLKKEPVPCLTYAALNDLLKEWGINDITISDVSRAVREIRNRKLPDPAVLGNAGSFFKNPVVPVSKLIILQHLYNNIPSFPADEGNVKIPAGWLIEQSGWKGKRVGNAGVHCDQALVIVNYGGATAKEILDLANQVTDDVKSRFGIQLEKEVNVV